MVTLAQQRSRAGGDLSAQLNLLARRHQCLPS
jgi:hypothetical protein